jgi:hypothetical protein
MLRDKLVALLYILMRDYVTVGDMTNALNQVSTTPQESGRANKHLLALSEYLLEKHLPMEK